MALLHLAVAHLELSPRVAAHLGYGPRCRRLRGTRRPGGTRPPEACRQVRERCDCRGGECEVRHDGRFRRCWRRELRRRGSGSVGRHAQGGGEGGRGTDGSAPYGHVGRDRDLGLRGGSHETPSAAGANLLRRRGFGNRGECAAGYVLLPQADVTPAVTALVALRSLRWEGRSGPVTSGTRRAPCRSRPRRSTHRSCPGAAAG